MWWLARASLSESTVAKNVLKHGTGAINVDACRVATMDNLNGGAYAGRWPSNFVLDHHEECCVVGHTEVHEKLTGGGGKLWSHYRDGTEDRAAPRSREVDDAVPVFEWTPANSLRRQPTTTRRGLLSQPDKQKVTFGPEHVATVI